MTKNEHTTNIVLWVILAMFAGFLIGVIVRDQVANVRISAAERKADGLVRMSELDKTKEIESMRQEMNNSLNEQANQYQKYLQDLAERYNQLMRTECLVTRLGFQRDLKKRSGK